MDERIIAHLDMDAFFAAVEEREKPYLKGLPIVVGADPQGGVGRGVVATANYAARAYGIKSAMPIARAWQLSEEARARGETACAFIVPRHGKYTKASEEVFSIVKRYAQAIERTSIDEAYLDLSHHRTFEHAARAARELKRAIRNELSVTGSVGIAPNKLVAKIASDMEKPDGLTIVHPEEVDAFLEPLSLSAVPGIGPKMVAQLHTRGIETVCDAKRLSWEELEASFGARGFGIYERLRGIDMQAVNAEPAERKSVGKHHTFDVDTDNMEEVLAVLREQAHEVIRVMHRRGFYGFRTTVLTVRFADFTTKTRALTVPEVLSGEHALELKAVKLALPFFDRRENPRGKPVRLIGLRVENLEH